MRFLRKSLIGLFLMAATLALLTYAVMMVRARSRIMATISGAAAVVASAFLRSMPCPLN